MTTVVDLKAPSAATGVAGSLKDSGFAVVTGHPIPRARLLDFYSAWDQFFLSDETSEYPADPATQAGYFSTEQAETAMGSDVPDLKEYFQYWPNGPLPASLKAVTDSLYTDLFKMAAFVLTALETHLPSKLWHRLDEPLSTCLSEQDTMLRILRYPPLSETADPDRVRAGAHEDINFITLLPTATAPGLQIRPADSDWQTVDAPDGSIVINIGDMLQMLTDGALPSTTHRVVNPIGADASRARLTAPLFCHPRPEMVLSDTHTAGLYLNERLAEINAAGLTGG